MRGKGGDKPKNPSARKSSKGITGGSKKASAIGGEKLIKHPLTATRNCVKALTRRRRRPTQSHSAKPARATSLAVTLKIWIHQAAGGNAQKLLGGQNHWNASEKKKRDKGRANYRLDRREKVDRNQKPDREPGNKGEPDTCTHTPKHEWMHCRQPTHNLSKIKRHTLWGGMG